MSDAHSFITILSRLPDPRVERSKEHEPTDLLVIAVCTLLVGGESFYDMEDFGHARMGWLQTFLLLPVGIPSHDTFNRLFQALVTCLPRARHGPLVAWRHYNGRADCKNVIKELCEGFGPPTLCRQSIWATEAAL